MPDDKKPSDSNSTDEDSTDEEERRIIEILKGGFETEYVLKQRVRAPLDDSERNPYSDS